MFSFKKKLIRSQDSNQDVQKDQLFFHDIINQTHGLLLFLSSKILANKGVDHAELLMMEKEIKTLQSLIRDHYKGSHKNLVQTYEWVPFSYAKLGIASLCHTYLENVEIKIEFVLNGHDENDLIYYPAFYRIMNNLIKNISESYCLHVEFVFTMKEAGLFIETKNLMNKAQGDNSSEYLARVILDEKTSSIKSLGLESIHHMAEEHGGSFSFEINNNVWINKIFLPVKSLKTDKIPA